MRVALLAAMAGLAVLGQVTSLTAQGRGIAPVEAAIAAVLRVRMLTTRTDLTPAEALRVVIEVGVETTALGSGQVPVLVGSNRATTGPRHVLVAVEGDRLLLLGGSEHPQLVDAARVLEIRLGRGPTADSLAALRLARLADPNGAEAVVMRGSPVHVPPSTTATVHPGRAVALGPAVCVVVASQSWGATTPDEQHRYCFQADREGRLVAWSHRPAAAQESPDTCGRAGATHREARASSLEADPATW